MGRPSSRDVARLDFPGSAGLWSCDGDDDDGVDDAADDDHV